MQQDVKEVRFLRAPFNILKGYISQYLRDVPFYIFYTEVAFWRNSTRRILPEVVLGSSLRNSILLGYL